MSIPLKFYTLWNLLCISNTDTHFKRSKSEFPEFYITSHHLITPSPDSSEPLSWEIHIPSRLLHHSMWSWDHGQSRLLRTAAVVRIYTSPTVSTSFEKKHITSRRLHHIMCLHPAQAVLNRCLARIYTSPRVSTSFEKKISHYNTSHHVDYIT